MSGFEILKKMGYQVSNRGILSTARSRLEFIPWHQIKSISVYTISHQAMIGCELWKKQKDFEILFEGKQDALKVYTHLGEKFIQSLDNKV
jgi:hypothetical protein